ncbi:hypothetical protein [Okeania sp. SIO1I7]|nr:hypothetical protein [Okeania sp. SIO1I7]NET28418.1 hypothetical protein [Okeania sp. SIO1I7]
MPEQIMLQNYAYRQKATEIFTKHFIALGFTEKQKFLPNILSRLVLPKT